MDFAPTFLSVLTAGCTVASSDWPSAAAGRLRGTVGVDVAPTFLRVVTFACPTVASSSESVNTLRRNMACKGWQLQGRAIARATARDNNHTRNRVANGYGSCSVTGGIEDVVGR